MFKHDRSRVGTGQQARHFSWCDLRFWTSRRLCSIHKRPRTKCIRIVSPLAKTRLHNKVQLIVQVMFENHSANHSRIYRYWKIFIPRQLVPRAESFSPVNQWTTKHHRGHIQAWRVSHGILWTLVFSIRYPRDMGVLWEIYGISTLRLDRGDRISQQRKMGPYIVISPANSTTGSSLRLLKTYILVTCPLASMTPTFASGTTQQFPIL